MLTPSVFRMQTGNVTRFAGREREQVNGSGERDRGRGKGKGQQAAKKPFPLLLTHSVHEKSQKRRLYDGRHVALQPRRAGYEKFPSAAAASASIFCGCGRARQRARAAAVVVVVHFLIMTSRAREHFRGK